jgi:hypothetical protein
MPVVKTIRNHKYQILNENSQEIKVIDKANGKQLRFTRIEGWTEDELNKMFPGLPVLRFKKIGYYFLDFKVDSQSMSIEVFSVKERGELERVITHLKNKNTSGSTTKEIKLKIKELEEELTSIPHFTGRISHSNLLNPAFSGNLSSIDLLSALIEISSIRDGLPRDYQADLYGKKMRRPKVIKDGKNIKI